MIKDFQRPDALPVTQNNVKAMKATCSKDVNQKMTFFDPPTDF